MTECGLCGEEFKNAHGVSMHKAYKHNNPWEDEEKLRQRYVENGETSYELADEWGCDSKTVRNWLDKYGIDRRQTGEWQRDGHVSLRVSERGYVYWQDHAGSSRGKRISVHRLLAIAEYGPSNVAGKHVHHKNGVKWDNRTENIKLADASEHIKHHQENGDVPIGPEAQMKGGYDPEGLFVDVPNDERYEGMYEELRNEVDR